MKCMALIRRENFVPSSGDNPLRLPAGGRRSPAGTDKEVLASGTELFACEYLVTGRMTGNGASMNGASA
jgi:hypothetical protein